MVGHVWRTERDALDRRRQAGPRSLLVQAAHSRVAYVAVVIRNQDLMLGAATRVHLCGHTRASFRRTGLSREKIRVVSGRREGEEEASRRPLAHASQPAKMRRHARRKVGLAV